MDDEREMLKSSESERNMSRMIYKHKQSKTRKDESTEVENNLDIKDLQNLTCKPVHVDLCRYLVIDFGLSLL